MKLRNKIFTYSALMLGTLGIGGMITSNHINANAKSEDYVYDNPLEKVSDARKGIQDGSIPSGHNLYIYNSAHDSEIHSEGINVYHTNSFSILGRNYKSSKQAYLIPLSEPYNNLSKIKREHKNITVAYKHAIRYNGKDLNVAVTFNLSHFHTAYGKRYLAISRYLSKGIFYSGFESGRVSIVAYHGNYSNHKNWIPLTNDWISIDSLNGVGTEYERMYNKYGYSLNSGNYGEWADYMNATPADKHDVNVPVGFTENQRRDNIGHIPVKGIESNNGDYADGGVPNKMFADYSEGSGHLPGISSHELARYFHGDTRLTKAQRRTIRSFYKNSIWYQLESRPVNVFDFGSGSTGHSAWFRISSHSFPHQPKRRPKVNYYYCGSDSKGKEHIYHHYRGKDHEIKRATLLKTKGLKPKMLHLNGKEANGKSDNDKTAKLIKHGKLSDVKAWLSDANCENTPIHHHHHHHHHKPTPKPTTPPKPQPTPIKKSVTDIHPAKIDGYKGGQLAHPDQDFDYKLKGKLPNVHKKLYTEVRTPNTGFTHNNHNHTWQPTVRYHKVYSVDGRDNYKVIDQIPKDVSVIGNPSLHINGTNYTIYTHNVNDGNNNYIEFQLNANELKEYNLGHYTVTIPVKANNLPKIHKHTKAGWTKFWNGGEDGKWDGNNNYQNNAYAQPDIHTGYSYQDGSYPSKFNEYNTKQYSNHVPVEIKRVKAHIYRYDWDNKLNTHHALFPENDTRNDSLGLNDDGCKKFTNDPDSMEFKNYRYNNYLYKNGKMNRDALIAKPYSKVGYVNTAFGVKGVSKYKNGNHGRKYRFINPMARWTNAQVMSNNTLNDSGSYSFKANEDTLVKNSEVLRGHRGNRSYRVPVNFNPDGCGNDAYSSKGFSQNDYFPYLVPHIDMTNIIPRDKHGYPIPNPTQHQIKLAKEQSNRMVIDTDTKRHGLPFHFNTTAFNQMYDNDYDNGNNFENDFNGITGNPSDMTKVKLVIKDPDTDDTLYSATRPLADLNKGDQDADVHYRGNANHVRFSDVEYPKGDYEWHGFIDNKALKQVKNNERYALQTRRDYHSDMKNGFPVKAYFKLASNPHQIELTQKPIHTHAYTSRNPSITNTRHNRKFGKIYNQNYGGLDVKNQPNDVTTNRTTFILPERTTKYGYDPHYISGIRESKEEMDMNQPTSQSAKSGYGLTGNVLGITYMGHMNTGKYAKQGTSLMTAYPKHFTTKDNEINTISDPYKHKYIDPYDANYKSGQPRQQPLRVAPMLHVDAHYHYLSGTHAENNGNYDGNSNDDKHLPDYLDNYDKSNDLSDYDDAKSVDKYYDDLSKGDGNHHVDDQMHTGIATTSYGYLPKFITSNRDADDNNQKIGGSHAGMTKLSDDPNDNLAEVSNHYDAKGWDDPYGSTTNHGYKISNYEWNNYQDLTPTVDDKINGQNERLFTRQFLHDGKYPLYYESMYGYKGVSPETKRTHRLGANFIRINDYNPVNIYGHMLGYIDSNSEQSNEFYLQPVLTNPCGLFQIPKAYPRFPKAYYSRTAKSDMGHRGTWVSIYDVKHNTSNIWDKFTD